MPSNIQVFVRFKEQSVFAGEDVQCTITFKNVAEELPSKPKQGTPSRKSSLAGFSPTVFNSGNGGFQLQSPRLPTVASQVQRNVDARTRGPPSLNIPVAASPKSPSFLSSGPAGIPTLRPAEKHQRSVSIISLGSPDAANDKFPAGQLAQYRSRPAGGHSHSTSFQVISGKLDGSGDVMSPLAFQPPRLSPNHRPSAGRAGTLTSSHQVASQSGGGSSNATSPHISPSISQDGSRRSSPLPPRSREPSEAQTHSLASSAGAVSSNVAATHARAGSSTETPINADSSPYFSPIGRVITGTSVAGSSRSSAEFHSLSDHSQETLASEQNTFMTDRPQFPSAVFRQHYKMDSPVQKKHQPEKLLMGYAQLNATFTLDGSLIDLSPFEEVKRKGFLGGQAGGGVVGVQIPQNTGGFLGGFNFNSIGESLGGFLGGGDLSSLKEMKGVTSSRAIPLLSTPQSLLFVDLQLAPGSEKTYSFACTIPKGLPSSHKGKAIKVAYDLVIGVQGAPGDKNMQAVRRVNVPFRVFSGVNDDGEIFGHDLMQPHVILRDLARTETIDNASNRSTKVVKPTAANIESSEQDFLAFVGTLLDKNRRRQSSSGTLEAPYGLLSSGDSPLAVQAINRAILFSNQVSSDRSSNRFDIARNGLRVAVIVLNRPLHRLGEIVTATIDFSAAHTPCFSLHASLETTERVNTAIALRSAASINRVTRRVHASHFENTLFSEKVIFSPSIPVSATPTLLTSGVNLDWGLRFEFATTRTTNIPGKDELPKHASLQEEIGSDERGAITAAVETVDCETFEVVIPITVYGDTVMRGKEEQDTTGLPI